MLLKVRSIAGNIEAIKSDYVELKEKFIKREESTNIAIILKPNIKGVKRLQANINLQLMVLKS